jgi:hypothetical protein
MYISCEAVLNVQYIKQLSEKCWKDLKEKMCGTEWESKELAWYIDKNGQIGKLCIVSTLGKVDKKFFFLCT